jgi:hypothetical protein
LQNVTYLIITNAVIKAVNYSQENKKQK